MSIGGEYRVYEVDVSARMPVVRYGLSTGEWHDDPDQQTFRVFGCRWGPAQEYAVKKLVNSGAIDVYILAVRELKVDVIQLELGSV